MSLIRLVALAMLLLPLSLSAQDEPINPLLSKNFSLSGGMFFPEKEFKVRVDGQVPGEDIDFGESFKLSDSDSTWAVSLRWRFGEKWSLFSQYWALDDTARATLEEDIAWEDVVLKQGTFAEAGFNLDVARFFFGRVFHASPKHEFGAGIGLHWLEIGASLEGQILTNMGETELYRDSVTADAPLPNIGAWYIHALSPKWSLNARIDWLSASIGDYSGGLTNAGLGVDWSITDHFGVGASYIYFKLDVDIDKSDWRGGAEANQHGPVLQAKFTW